MGGFGTHRGAAGNDAATKTADLALMTDESAKLRRLLDDSRHTLGMIRHLHGVDQDLAIEVRIPPEPDSDWLDVLNGIEPCAA